MSERRYSKGLNQFFFSMGPNWKIYSKIRSFFESTRGDVQIISREVSLVDYIKPDIAPEEITPWLSDRYKPTYSSTLSAWDEDYWMTKEINSISLNKRILNNVYNTFISRNEKQFYLDYCPIRWSFLHSVETFKTFNNALELFVEGSTTPACNFALSTERPRKFISNLSKEFSIECPKKEITILWARYDFLRRFDCGLNMIRIHRMMGLNALKYGLPPYKLNNLK